MTDFLKIHRDYNRLVQKGWTFGVGRQWVAQKDGYRFVGYLPYVLECAKKAERWIRLKKFLVPFVPWW